MPPEVDQRIPDLQLPNARGGSVRLSDVTKEKIAVLVFYRGGWCPICNRQLAALSADYESFRRLGAEIVAISNEEVEKGRNLPQDAGPPFLLLQDPNGEVIRSFGLRVRKRDALGVMMRKQGYATPAVFIVDRDGIVRWKYVGRDYKDRPTNDAILDALTPLTDERVARQRDLAVEAPPHV